MGLTQLLLFFFVCTVHASDGTVSQPPLLDLLSEAVEGVVPCMLPCLLQDISATLQALIPCANQTVTDLTHFLKDNDIKDYTDLYNKATVKSNGLSAFCRFFDETSSCLEGAVSGLCSNGTAAHLQSLLGGIRSYANCQGNLLPVLQCAMHPEMFRSSSGYMECVGELVDEVNEKYLREDGMFYWDDFYEKAIIADKGIGVRRLLTNFGTCLDTEIALVTGCEKMRGHVLPQFEDIRNFLDINHNAGTDALVCFGKTTVHIAYERCTSRLVEDIVSAPYPALPDMWVQKLPEYLSDITLHDKAVQLLTEHLADGTLEKLWQEMLLLARPYYMSYTACLTAVTEQHCGYHWSAQEVIKINQPTDRFIMGLRPPLTGPDCVIAAGPDKPSGGVSQVRPLWCLHTLLIMTSYTLW